MTSRMSVAGSLAIVVLLGVVTVATRSTYPSVGGYDAQEYITYAHDLVTRGVLRRGDRRVSHASRISGGRGCVVELARGLDLDDPGHPGQLVSAVAVSARLPARSSPRTDALAVETGRLAGCHSLLRLPPDGRESGCDVPSRAARDAPDGGRAPRPRAHGSHAPVRVVARGLARAAPRPRASSFAHGRSGWLVVAVVVLGVVALTDRELRRRGR